MTEQHAPKTPKIREGEFRSYDVSKEEVLRGTEDSLKVVGYQLLAPNYIGFVRPDFHGQRKEGDVTYEIVGVVSSGLEEAIEGLTKLAAMKAFLGDKPEYVLVLPPINEYLLLEFLEEDKGRIYYQTKEQGFLFWMYSDWVDGIWCWIGGSRDQALADYFVLPQMSVDTILQMRLSQVLLEEEEEELRRGR